MIDDRDLEQAERAFTPPDGSFDRFLRRRDRKRRNQRIAAGVVGIAVFVAAVWIVTSGWSFNRSQTPAVPGPTVTGPTVPSPSTRIGFIGLPPEGATPSTPERGELVLEFHGPSTDMWMYADGRLIWMQFDANVPFGASANDRETGLLERRLTPEGLDRMLSEVISTGLFDKNLDLAIEGLTPADSGPQAIKCGFGPGIEVRNGERLVRLTWLRGCGEPELQLATPEQVDAVVRLVGRLADPASWLPEHAWEDQEIRAYVPSRYAICASRVDPSVPRDFAGRGFLTLPVPVKTSEIVDQLPGPVKALIFADGRVIPARGWGGCYEVTTDEARAIVRALDDAGLDPELGSSNSMSLTYIFDTPELRWAEGFVSFLTILPHGFGGAES